MTITDWTQAACSRRNVRPESPPANNTKEPIMANLKAKSFEAPDEQRTPGKTVLDVVDLEGMKAARLTAQPR
jgi:hypothetical protein